MLQDQASGERSQDQWSSVVVVVLFCTVSFSFLGSMAFLLKNDRGWYNLELGNTV